MRKLDLRHAHQEHRHGRSLQDSLGDGPEEQPTESAPPMRRHPDEVGGDLPCGFHDLLGGSADANERLDSQSTMFAEDVMARV